MTQGNCVGVGGGEAPCEAWACGARRATARRKILRRIFGRMAVRKRRRRTFRRRTVRRKILRRIFRRMTVRR